MIPHVGPVRYPDNILRVCVILLCPQLLTQVWRMKSPNTYLAVYATRRHSHKKHHPLNSRLASRACHFTDTLLPDYLAFEEYLLQLITLGL